MTDLRPSTRFFALLAVLSALALGAVLHARHGKAAGRAALAEGARLVRTAGLTDLCLFPEANYTRHLSQADRHAPFQDGPLSLEKFPAGSLTRPPRPRE